MTSEFNKANYQNSFKLKDNILYKNIQKNKIT